MAQIEKLTDVNVVLDINRPTFAVGLGIPLILVKGNLGYKSYENLKDLSKDFAVDTDVNKVAKVIFDQDNRLRQIDVLSYSDIESDFKKYFFNTWHFALFADVKPDENDVLTISNIIEEQQFKFVVINETMESPIDTLEPLYAGNTRTILTVSDTDQRLDAAIVGDASSQTVGSITWKFRKNLKDVVASNYTADDVRVLTEAKAITYVVKAGEPQTSEGITLSGEYIDALHGDDWVKDNLETNIQHLLASTDKVTYDASGISLLTSSVLSTLQEAFTNGIIQRDDETQAGDFDVTALNRSDMSIDNIQARHYDGISFEYTRSGAIHSVKIHGTVNA